MTYFVQDKKQLNLTVKIILFYPNYLSVIKQKILSQH